MLALIRIFAILVVVYVILMMRDEYASVGFFILGVGCFCLFNILFVFYHPFVGIISVLSLILLGVLFVVGSKKDIEEYKLRRMLYPLLGVYTLSFLIELIETLSGRLF